MPRIPRMSLRRFRPGVGPAGALPETTPFRRSAWTQWRGLPVGGFARSRTCRWTCASSRWRGPGWFPRASGGPRRTRPAAGWGPGGQERKRAAKDPAGFRPGHTRRPDGGRAAENASARRKIRLVSGRGTGGGRMGAGRPRTQARGERSGWFQAGAPAAAGWGPGGQERRRAAKDPAGFRPGHRRRPDGDPVTPGRAGPAWRPDRARRAAWTRSRPCRPGGTARDTPQWRAP
jgi:hypothetical protein